MQKRLPALLGILFMVGGAFAGVVIVLQGTFFSPQASPETVPQKVKITNLTENSFVVSWTTQGQAVGYILLGEEEKQLKRSIADQRDQLSGEGGQYKMHHIYVRELRPSTTYYFKIGSGERELFDNNGVPFTVQTAAVLGTPPPPETIYGTVLTPAKTAADDTIVYVGIPGSTPLSALVQQKGSFAIPLSTARTLSLDNYVSIDPDTTIEMLAQSGRGEVSRIRAKLSQAQPLADIVLGNSDQVLDISDQAPTSPSSSDSKEGSIIKGTTPGIDPLSRTMTGNTTSESKFVFEDVSTLVDEASEVITIEQLPADHVTIPNVQPNFSGQAPPNTTLTVTINSPRAYVDTVAADSLGNWSYEVPGELEPGPHTIALSFTDENGILKQVKRTFIVNAYAAEGTPSYTSTPSASLAPTITSAPKTLITQVPMPTTVIRAALPATDSAIPVSGSTANTFALSLGGVLLMSLGYFLYRYGNAE